jgi:UMF1 family MFS transporter
VVSGGGGSRTQIRHRGPKSSFARTSQRSVVRVAHRHTGPVRPPTIDRAAARRRAVSGFTLYDAANSAFVTTVVTALGGPFLTALAEAAADDDGRLAVLGLAPRAGSLFAYAVSLSVLLQVVALPVLGALADRRSAKRRVLAGATCTGALATVVVALTPAAAPLLGFAAFVVANVAFGAAITVYNAYLADVADAPDRHRVSARGFAFGYAGGALVLALALGLLTAVSPLGLERGTAVRLAVAGSGLWWLTLGAVAVRRLDAVRALHPAAPSAPPFTEELAESLRRLRESLRALRALPQTARFLASFLLFNDAIQAVVALSAVVLTQELFVARGEDADDATPFLLTLVLVIQVVAVAGALASSRLAERYGAKPVLLAMLAVWTGVVLYAVVSLETTTEALVLGVVIALVLGGSQSIARSLFSRMVPLSRQASFFGFYELAERGTAWVGTLVFAVVLDVTGSYRGAFLSLVVLFVSGAALLAVTDTDAAVRAAERADAAAADQGADDDRAMRRPAP